MLLAPLCTTSLLIAQDSLEKPKQLPAPIVRKYDADRDGVLNESEKEAWKADVQRGRAEAQTRKLEKYDANRDGKLDKAEKAAAAADTTKKTKPAAKPLPNSAGTSPGSPTAASVNEADTGSKETPQE